MGVGMGPATSVGLVHTGVKVVFGVNTSFWKSQNYFMWGGLKNPVVVGVVGKPRAKRPFESTNSERRVMKPGL